MDSERFKNLLVYDLERISGVTKIRFDDHGTATEIRVYLSLFSRIFRSRARRVRLEVDRVIRGSTFRKTTTKSIWVQTY